MSRTAGRSPLRFRLAAGAAIAAFGLPVLAGITGFTGLPAATAQTANEPPEWVTETPAERCARQTAEWNASMEAAWRAAHPGEEPGPGAWPPYVCVDVPTPDVPVPPVPPVGGGSVTIGNPPGREHQWDIRGDEPSEYREDMELGSARDHRAAPRDGATGTTGARAGDSARSNVTLPSGWSTTTTDNEGNARDVRVVDTDDGVLVVDPDGRATGDVLVTDPETGETRLEHHDGVAGLEVGAPENGADGNRASADATGAAGGGPADPAVAADADDADTGGIDPAMPVGVAGALAGAFVATRGSRGARNARGGSGCLQPSSLPGLDAAPRVTINHLTGAEQTIFALMSPDSDHTQEFDLNIPEGGHAAIRTDGGVDVFDAEGNVVRQIAPPWAFDSRGIPQPTWFTIDPETGNLVQHVAPLEGALYPIIADPKDRPRNNKPKNIAGQTQMEERAEQRAEERRMDEALGAAARNGNNDPAEVRPRLEAEFAHEAAVEEQRQRDNAALAAASTGNNDPAEGHTQVGLVDTTGFEEGDQWNVPLDDGSTAQHTMVTGMEGLAVQSRILKEDGTVVEVYTVADDDGGFQSWGKNPDGGANYTAADGTGTIDSQDWGAGEDVNGPARVTSHSEDGGETWQIRGRNPDGTISRGEAEQVSAHRWVLEVENGDGSETRVDSTAQAGTSDVSTLVNDELGYRVGNSDGIVTPIDEFGNDVTGGKEPVARTGRFYDPVTGYWHDGVVDQETGARTFRLDDGRYLIESTSISGPTGWQVTGEDGEVYLVRDLSWDPETGEPIILSQDETPIGILVDPENGEALDNWEASVGPLNTVSGIIDGQSALVDQLTESKKPTGGFLRTVGEGASSGWRGLAKPIPGLGYIVTGAAIASDVQGGADVDEAVATEGLGMISGAVGGGAAGGVALALGAPAIVVGGATVLVGGAAAFGASWIFSHFWK